MFWHGLKPGIAGTRSPLGNSKVKMGEDEIARYLGKDNLGASREVPEI